MHAGEDAHSRTSPTSFLISLTMTAVEYTCHDGTELDALFPTPSLPPTVLCPQRYAGSSPEALAALRYVLKDNHAKYHIFINDQKWHKCVSS
jgi:hypothetical protein